VDYFINIANEAGPDTTSVIAGDANVLKRAGEDDGVFSKAIFVVTINRETEKGNPVPMWMIQFDNDFEISVLFLGFKSDPEIRIIKATGGIGLSATKPEVVKREADEKEYEGYMFIYKHINSFMKSIMEGLSRGSITYDD
jgi:hypothetical protein